MGEKAKYSWAVIFDEVKMAYPLRGVILVKSKRKYKDPFTPRTIADLAHMYAQYEPKTSTMGLYRQDRIYSRSIQWRLGSMVHEREDCRSKKPRGCMDQDTDFNLGSLINEVGIYHIRSRKRFLQEWSMVQTN